MDFNVPIAVYYGLRNGFINLMNISGNNLEKENIFPYYVIFY